MCFRMARWLGSVSLSAAVLWALAHSPAAAQDTKRPVAKTGTDLRPTPARTPSTVQIRSKQTSPAAEASASDRQQPLKPVADPLGSGPAGIEAASFKGVTPGETSMEAVEKAWGAPKEITKQGKTLVGLYAVEPFDRVEVSFYDDKVTAVVIRFDRGFPANTVAQQLELTDVRPVLVSNELGEILGQVYPERGVLFAFEAADVMGIEGQLGGTSRKVAQIILEPISAEPFVLRAEVNLESAYQSSLQDLKQALQLQPGNARAHWLQSRVLVSMGDFEKAVAASGQAVRLEPGNPQYRVTRAQILGHVGQMTEAVRQAQKAVETSQSRPHVKARALCLLGDLAASGAKPDYKRAIQYHMQAVKAADPLAADRHPAIRLAAKEVLLDAHLGAAHDIAWGTWKQKEQAVTKWLALADGFAEDLIENEGRSRAHRFRVSTRALAACVGVRGGLDPAKWTKEAMRTGEQLITTAEDPLRKAQLQWDLGMALYDALQIYQMRNDHDTALKYGEWAVEYLEKSDRQKQSPSNSYLLGRLYFRLGAVHAIRDQNHRVAITWFDRAVPLLQKPTPKEAFDDLGRHGETFVSMGVSYWESGQREKAVDLTDRGIELMQKAVKQGSLEESALTVPYENLASMHRQLGRDEKAERFEGMATKIKDTRLK